MSISVELCVRPEFYDQVDGTSEISVSLMANGCNEKFKATNQNFGLVKIPINSEFWTEKSHAEERWYCHPIDPSGLLLLNCIAERKLHWYLGDWRLHKLYKSNEKNIKGVQKILVDSDDYYRYDTYINFDDSDKNWYKFDDDDVETDVYCVNEGNLLWLRVTVMSQTLKTRFAIDDLH
jgi:hypothetical protein